MFLTEMGSSVPPAACRGVLRPFQDVKGLTPQRRQGMHCEPRVRADPDSVLLCPHPRRPLGGLSGPKRKRFQVFTFSGGSEAGMWARVDAGAAKNAGGLQ